MNTVICKQCRQEFPADRHGESIEWDLHECPAMPDIPAVPGESYEDFLRRCKEAEDRGRIGT